MNALKEHSMSSIYIFGSACLFDRMHSTHRSHALLGNAP